jgi:hypothetical protein
MLNNDRTLIFAVKYANTFFESVIVAENGQNCHRDVQGYKCL